MNQTQLSLMFLTMLIMLEDYYAAPRQYPDSVLLQAAQSMVMLNKLKAMGNYSLTPDGLSITPAIVGPGADPNTFALAVYYAIKLLLGPKPDEYRYKTRGFSEQWRGTIDRYLTSLELDIHEIEDKSMFLGWQSYHTWVAGMAGLPVGLVLTQVDVSAPFFTANVSTAGVVITPTSPTT